MRNVVNSLESQSRSHGGHGTPLLSGNRTFRFARDNAWNRRRVPQRAPGPSAVPDDHLIIVQCPAPMASIIVGLLEQRPQRRRSSLPLRRGRVVRCDSLDEARSLASTTSPVSLITVDNLSSDVPLLDGAGKRVQRFDATKLTDALLGRTLPILLPRSAPPTISSWATSRTKRGVDVVLALALIVLFLPAMVATGIVVWVRTRRAPLNRQLRLGRYGDPISLVRFRNPSEPVTPQGGFLSTTALENPARYVLLRLPMLLNVVRGDLSLVGPAPQLLGEPTSQTKAVSLRRSVRPGCLQWKPGPQRHHAQRGERGIAYDLYYIRSATPLLDLQIVATAFKRSLSPHRWWPGTTPPRMTARPDAITLDHDRTAPGRSDGKDGGTAGGHWESALIVGIETSARLTALRLLHHPEWKILPVGFVADWPGPAPKRLVGIPVLGKLGDLADLITRHEIGVVIVANRREIGLGDEVVASVRRTGARLMWLSDNAGFMPGDGDFVSESKIDVQQVLGRPPMVADAAQCRAFLAGKRVLITGAAGSIGQELARQTLRHDPGEVILLDTNETGLFDLNIELKQLFPGAVIRTVIASVTSPERMEDVFASHEPDVVLHAAAYKHVPMMEDHPQEAVLVNSIGTWTLAQTAARHHVERFVLISTDKAVRPASVMGASKRLAELAVRAVSSETGLSACCVRFGNVLGSRGSVIPIFEKQIAAGGPITITDPRMRRYFMTIPEAASLTIQAAADRDQNAIFMLNMGEEIAIRDLAERLVRLHGMTIGREIQIEYVGLREGEKLHEELALDTEIRRPTDHPDIFRLEESVDPIGDQETFRRQLRELEQLAHRGQLAKLRERLFAAVSPSAPVDGMAVAIAPPGAPVVEADWTSDALNELVDRFPPVATDSTIAVAAPGSDEHALMA